jgi:hypothetical protein
MMLLMARGVHVPGEQRRVMQVKCGVNPMISFRGASAFHRPQKFWSETRLSGILPQAIHNFVRIIPDKSEIRRNVAVNPRWLQITICLPRDRF